MQIQRVTTTPLELVSVRELKEHMRIDHDVEDDLLRNLQRAAYDWVEQFTSRSLLTTQWKLLSLPLKAGSEIGQSLPFPNLLEIEDVHHVFNQSHKERERRYTICQRNETPYIYLISKGVPIEVLYNAGFGPYPSAVPEAFHYVIKVLVAYWYQNREGLSCGIPDTVELFLRQYQIKRLI